MGKFAVTDVKTLEEARKKARRIISRRNEDPRASKGNEQTLKNVKKSSGGKTLGGRGFKSGTYFIATTRKRK